MKRTRRLLSILLVTVMLTALMPASAHAAFEDEPCKECGHTDWELLDESFTTCDEPAERLWRCRYCYRHETEYIPVLGHNYEKLNFPHTDREGILHTPKAPTCTEPGVDVYSCTRCDHTFDQVVPALGHSLDAGTVITPPTCTADGVAEFRCLRCGEKLTVPIPAPGHTWDEGTTTTPDGLYDGYTLRTCLICGEKETTVIPVNAADLFSRLRNIPVDAETASPLKITQQPQGGSLPPESEDGLTMTLKVEGGLEPYTYEWHRRSFMKDDGDSTLSAVVKGTGADLDKLYQSKARDWYGATAATYEDVFSDGWLDAAKTGFDSQVLDDLLLGNEALGASEDPEYTAYEGGFDYWCVVRDAAGKPATSEAARVYGALTIAEHPHNANLQKDADEKGCVLEECQATGGSGEYRYTWYQDYIDESTLPYGLYQQCECMDPGVFFCRVTDLVTGEEADSNSCLIYDTEPLKIVSITGTNDTFWPEEEREVTVTVEGGTPPYGGWLYIDGVWANPDDNLIDAVGPDGEGRYTLTATGVGGTVYEFHVMDGMGEQDSVATPRWERKLTIGEQPEDGVLRRSGSVEVACTVADGIAPYSYDLYRNGEPHQNKTSNGRFKVVVPGEYYIRVTDSKGHTGETKTVTVENEKFHVTDYSASAEITQAGKGVRLYVEVSGGEPPYSYEWLELTDRGWVSYELGAQSAFYAGTPGTYACRIKDSGGDPIRSKDMEVTYSGDTPVIVTQPRSVRIPEDGSSVRLTCRAVSGSGNDDDLLYVWYKLTEGTPYMNETQYGYGTQSIKTSSPACYYCRVTDRSTGKSVESNYVWIVQELQVNPGTWSSIDPDQSASNWCEFRGGMPPYRVKVYATVNGSAVLCGETVVQKEGYAWVDFDPYFTTGKDAKGDPVNVLCPFSFRIFDCSGQETRCFPDPGKIHYMHEINFN